MALGQKKSRQTHFEKAEEFYNSHQFENAVNQYKLALENEISGEILYGLTQSLFERAWQLQMNGGHTAEVYTQTLQFATQLYELDPSNADYMLLLAKAYQYNSRFEESKNLLERVAQNHPNNGLVYYQLWTMEPQDALSRVNHKYVSMAFERDPNLADFYAELASYYKMLNDADNAIQNLNKSLEIRKTSKAHFSLAQVYMALGNEPEARTHLDASIDIFPEFSWAYISKAGVELYIGNINAAVPLIRKAIGLNPQTQQYADAYKQNYPALANYNFSSKSSDESQAYDEQGYPQFYSSAVQLAQAFDFEGSIRRFHQAMDKYSQLSDANPTWTQSMLSWLAHCYRELGDYAKAVHVGAEALRLAKDNNFTTDLAALNANLAIIYQTWGDYPKAIEYGKRSIDYLNRYGPAENLFDAYINQGTYYRNWGQYDSAILFHKMSLEASTNLEVNKRAIANSELAHSSLRKGDLISAEKLIENGLELLKGQNINFENASIYLVASRVHAAHGRYKEALQVTQNFGDDVVQYILRNPSNLDILPILISCHIGLGNYVEAEQIQSVLNNVIYYLMHQFFPALSENGKTLFYQTLKEHFESYCSFALLEVNQSAIAINHLFQNQIVTKGILFDNSLKMRRNIAKTGNEEQQALYDKIVAQKNLIARAATLSKEEKLSRNLDIEKLSQSIDSLEILLSASHATFNAAKVYEKDRLKAIQNTLNDDEAVVEIVRFRVYDFEKGGRFTDDIKYVALILKGGQNEIEVVLLDNGNYLEKQQFTAYSNAIQFELQDKRSYEAYWAPIQQKLKGIERVFVSADGVYHKLNLNTLWNSSTEKYLIDALDVRRITSSRDLLTEEIQLPKKGEVVLVGYPKYDMKLESDESQDKKLKQIGRSRAFISFEDVSLLPGTKTEVGAIDRLLKKTKYSTKVLMEEHALEENVKSVNLPTILHIATHGYFESHQRFENPLIYSGLLLSGASSQNESHDLDQEDGILTAYEAMHLNLDQTPLVVLSACETGVGRIENGEGVFGLQRALLIAGARALIMSLWKVDDEATMKLMITFYEDLLQNGDKHAALKAAQIEVRKEFPNPKYWGAFTIIGQ